MPDPILIIGDVVHDEVVELEQSLASAEGLLTYVELRRSSYAGGAANVAKHCARLGARVSLFHEGPLLSFSELESHERARITCLCVGRDTVPRKTRFYCGAKKVFKVNGVSLPRCFTACDVEFFRTIVRGPWGAVLACDNGHGMLTGLERMIVESCAAAGRPLFVDAQFSRSIPAWAPWKGATEVFLNLEERNLISDEELNGFSSYHVKRGELGSQRFDLDGGLPWLREIHHGFRVDAIDTVGAGDAYLAAWAVHRNLSFANAWAALSCTQIGTRLPELKEMEGLDADLARFC